MIVVTRRDVVPALAFDLPVALIASVLRSRSMQTAAWAPLLSAQDRFSC